MKTVIHVNRHFIAMNRKDGKHRPVYTVKRAGRVTYAHGVKILSGSVEFVDPRVTPPLSCGARAWAIVTNGVIKLTGAMSFRKAQAI